MQNNQTHYINNNNNNNNSNNNVGIVQYQIQSPPKMQTYQTQNKMIMKQENVELNNLQQRMI